MKISIISGSHRNPSQSEKVARYLEQTLNDDFDDIQPWVYTLADNPLPLWDQTLWDNSEEWEQRLAPIKQQLIESDGFIIVSPEWHGQVPAGLKNFFLLFNRFVMGHKPALIVTVSSSSYKNNRICYIPEHLILRHVEKILNAKAEDNDADADSYFRERIAWALGILRGYAVALKAMRESTAIHHDKFGNGM